MPKVGIEANMAGKAGMDVRSPAAALPTLVIGPECGPGDEFPVNIFVDGKRVNISGKLVLQKNMAVNIDVSSWTLEVLKLHVGQVDKDQAVIRASL